MDCADSGGVVVNNAYGSQEKSSIVRKDEFFMNSETFVGMSESNAASVRMNGFTYMLASTALLAIIAFADASAIQFPLTMGVIGTGLYGMLTFDFGMQTAMGLRDSMPDEIASTKAGQDAQKAPFAMYRVLNAVILILIAIAQITVIY